MVYNNDSAKERLLAGAKLLYDTVKSTFGPNGKNVIIRDGNNQIVVTKDGVTAANAVYSNDPIEQLGIDILRASANKSVKATGDGTSTTTILAYNMLNNHVKDIAAFRELSENILQKVKQKLKERSFIINTKDHKEILYNVALTSANNNKKIAEVVSDVIAEIDKDGHVEVTDADNNGSISLELIEGYSFNRGFESHKFVNNPKKVLVDIKTNSRVLIVDKKIERFEEIIDYVKFCKQNNEPLLVVAEEFSPSFINNCLLNLQAKNQVVVIPVKLPEFGQFRNSYLSDLATFTGATSTMLNLIDPKNLGFCRGFNVSATKTTVFFSENVSNKPIHELIELLHELIKSTTNEHTLSKYKDRLTQLMGTNAIIRVGSSSAVETKELIDLIDDAVGACQSALRNGVLPGGGVALYKIACEVEEELNVNLEALKTPFKILNSIENKTTTEVASYVELVLNMNEYFNKGVSLRTKEVVDLVSEGIIDSHDTVLNCVENAMSVANSLLTSSSVIINKDYERN